VLDVGLTIFVSIWYLWKRDHGYVPHILLETNNEVNKGIVAILVGEGRGARKCAEREHA